MVDRFEKVLHPLFGEREYWLARKSMGYAKHLKAEAEAFMAKHLPARDPKSKKKGLPYLAVHLRRGDFLRAYWGHKGVPKTLESAAAQIKDAMKKQKLKAVYIATDSSPEEVATLRKLLPTMVRYEPTKTKLHKFGDGGVSIIDQWLCANAQYFIGTDPSTFTFRIGEDREILGFPSETTFNGLCLEGYKDRNDEEKCAHPTAWKINL